MTAPLRPYGRVTAGLMLSGFFKRDFGLFRLFDLGLHKGAFCGVEGGVACGRSVCWYVMSRRTSR